MHWERQRSGLWLHLHHRVFLCIFKKGQPKQPQGPLCTKTKPIGGYFRFYKKPQEISYPNYCFSQGPTFQAFFIDKFSIIGRKKCDFSVILPDASLRGKTEKRASLVTRVVMQYLYLLIFHLNSVRWTQSRLLIFNMFPTASADQLHNTITSYH